MTRVALRCAVLAASVLLAAPAWAQDAVVAREIALLEFFGGGSPLTPAERAEAAEIVALQQRTDPRQAAVNDANGAQLLHRIAAGADAGTELIRAQVRRTATFGHASNPAFEPVVRAEGRIIAAHDPAVVADPAHERLITQHAVEAMVAADRAGARLFSVPSPGADAVPALADRLRAEYGGLDEKMQEFLAQADGNLPYATRYLETSGRDKLAGFVAQWRPQIMAVTDPVEQQLRLTEVMAVAGSVGAKQAAGGGGSGGTGGLLADQMIRQSLLQQKMLGATRSFSPRCNTATGAAQANTAFCNP
jgi:hypothetical protein